MTTTIRAMRPEDIPHVLDACQDWEELSRFGPPYWRPRSSAELHRKISTPAGPQPATAYSFVITNDGRLVGECSLHAIDWRNRHTQVGICVWHPEDRRHGYGRAGVEFLISWATPKPRPPPSKNRGLPHDHHDRNHLVTEPEPKAHGIAAASSHNPTGTAHDSKDCFPSGPVVDCRRIGWTQ